MTSIDPDILWKALERDKQQVALLSRIGEALYGDRWQTQLARALGISSRTVRRWVLYEAQYRGPYCMKSFRLSSKPKLSSSPRFVMSSWNGEAVHAPEGRVQGLAPTGP